MKGNINLKDKKENQRRDTYILDNHCEVKIILSTIPHKKIFIRNENGVLIVANEAKKVLVKSTD